MCSSSISKYVQDAERLRALDELKLLDTPPEDGFEDIVHLAALVCSTPVALVSLVAGDRQWFKARIGFVPFQTDLDASVCVHALSEPDLLVIPDLTIDPRTRDNPLVVGEPFIRFYAGAPLQGPDGHALGSLCVIDSEARPAGLNAKQADGLRRLSRQVTTILRERRQNAQLRVMQAEREAKAIHWRNLFSQLHEGFVIGEVVRDGDRRITDWRYVEVNRAWGDLVGIPAERAIGRNVRDVFPGVEDVWIKEFAQVVETGEPITFNRQSNVLDRWYEGRAQRLGPDTFTVLFLDVTEHVLAERAARARQAQLLTMMESVPIGIMLAEAPSGRVLMGNRRLADILGHDTLYATSSNAYGDFVAYHADGRRVDASEFPLAQISSGVCERSTIEVHYQRPDGERRWVAIAGEAIRDDRGELVGVVVVVTDIGSRKDADAQQDVLNHELSHRLKNTLTLVQAIAAQTLRNAPDIDTAREALASRLIALGKAHDILLDGRADSACVAAVVRGALDLHDDTGCRFQITGPSLFIGPSTTLSLGLLLHELATNAVKYGALSVPEGSVAINWIVEGEGPEGTFRFDWRERGGPLVIPPTRKGFGSRLIERGLSGGDVALSYPTDGVTCTLTSPLRGLRVNE
ncbi:HWE histidine kinase domain-containing protein [Methylobacterium sp. J-092]|uniref:HWE histidine kinase domain-containing protein n=1 Tax=Methylobacterium sp. J-092 TaxID=2836667 RepID=UPI001FBB5F61|nr:HWE histidine kinase domain-containing protein [Methylobacterium sp. J-092]MCJ2005867.1 PAS domain S-box protein [Methylobacterium sp. J-092]